MAVGGGGARIAQPPVARLGPLQPRSALFLMVFTMRGCLRGLAHLGWVVLQHHARCAHMRCAHCASPGTLRQRGYIEDFKHAVVNLAFGSVNSAMRSYDVIVKPARVPH